MQTSPDPKIVQKIQKLLALGESPNEAEAAAALEKAQLLLAKNGLKMGDLGTDQQAVVEKELLQASRLRSWKALVLNCVLNASFTTALKVREGKTGRILLIGREENVIAAENLFGYLIDTINKTSKKYKSVIRHLDSFRYGMAEMIRQRLQEMEKKEKPDSEEKALVVSMDHITKTENRDYLKEKYGKVRTQKRNSVGLEPDSYGLGKKVGNKVSLDPQLEQ